jgi:hypothetical protein
MSRWKEIKRVREREREKDSVQTNNFKNIFLVGHSLAIVSRSMSYLTRCFRLVFVITRLAIVSRSMSYLIRCFCLVFVITRLCNWVKFDVTFNSLLLFSVCEYKSCNWVKF